MKRDLSMDELGKAAGDAAAVGTGVYSFFSNGLPIIVSILTICWFAIRIYETKTVQGLIAKFK